MFTLTDAETGVTVEGESLAAVKRALAKANAAAEEQRKAHDADMSLSYDRAHEAIGRMAAHSEAFEVIPSDGPSGVHVRPDGPRGEYQSLRIDCACGSGSGEITILDPPHRSSVTEVVVSCAGVLGVWLAAGDGANTEGGLYGVGCGNDGEHLAMVRVPHALAELILGQCKRQTAAA